MPVGNIDIATIVTIVVIVTFITFVTNTTIMIIWTIVTFITNVTKVTIVTIVIIVTTVTIIATILIICLCPMGSPWPISILRKHEKMQKCKFHANFEPRELILSSCTPFRFEESNLGFPQNINLDSVAQFTRKYKCKYKYKYKYKSSAT